MFKDLKEYQEITQLYHDSVNISEEQRVINTAIAEAKFTVEEIKYLEENFDEIWESELATLTEEVISDCLVEENLTEEQLQEVVKKLAPKAVKTGVKAASGLPGMIKKGISAVKKRIPQGVKDTVSGGVSVAKSAMKKVGGVVKKVAPKVLKKLPGIALPAAAIGGVVAGVNKLRNIGKEKREKETKITPPKPIGGGNAGASTDSGGTAGPQKTETKTDTKPKTTETKTQTSTTTTTPQKKMSSIEKKNRARFGDERVDMLKAKNKDFQAMKKGSMTKDEFIKKYPKSITAQRSKGLRDQTEWDAYDLVLEYLMSTEQVATIEEANYVMMQLDKENIQEIVGGAVKGLKAIGRFGAKSPKNFAITMAGTGLVGQTAVKPIVQTLAKVTAPKVETPKVQTSTDDIQVGSGIEQRKKGESLMDYYKRRKNNLETQDRKLGNNEY